ncbi:hypothetical protein DS742_19350 [Lacrimispora amygdalina]|uniref:Uncharacterized protein n=1 Tax=Lacrimispora amygdalina TaxID=253257 RepID=A0A3E2N8M6_9FIRM|nr:hypothetical protein [Clostridium indicum]RFZ77346.1 hypothetical protein DS742_19350 [Clostridium indicum]
MPNVISIKRRKVVKISRGARGEGIIRIDSEAVDVLESFLQKANGELSVKELASNMIKYASNDTIIRIEEEDQDGEA